jgi:hypothetical protein
MKTHNAIIYHCQACGRVAHAELGVAAPQCCGTAMTKACGETIREGEVSPGAPDKVSERSEPSPPAIEGRNSKPK